MATPSCEITLQVSNQTRQQIELVQRLAEDVAASSKAALEAVVKAKNSFADFEKALSKLNVTLETV